MRLPLKLALIIFAAILVAVFLSSFLIFSFSPPPIDQVIILFVLILILIILPITFVLWMYLQKIIVKPILSFNSISKIISSGNLGKRIEIFSKDEIGELGQNINTIIGHLVGAFQNMAFSLRNEKNKEKQLAVSLAQLRVEKAKDEALLGSMGDSVIAISQDKKILVFNKAASKLTGFTSTEALNKPYADVLKIINEKEGIPADEFIANAFTGIGENKSKHLAVLTKNRGAIPVSYSAGLIYDAKGSVISVIVVLRDITQERQLERMKDEFVSIASHELRTPMSAIKSLISMIFEGDFGAVNEGLKDPLSDVAKATERLIQLVNDVLDVSRIEAGRLKIMISDVPVIELVAEVVKLMQILAGEKGIKIVVEPIGQEIVRTDPKKVKEILNNLIGNALKFTDKGQITVFARKSGNFLNISVADSGIGIAKQDQPKLFTKFSQISADRLVRPLGTGLGLYISREFVRKLGGDLWLEYSEVDRGSIFTFSLPLVANNMVVLNNN